jgi:hypothetical protein
VHAGTRRAGVAAGTFSSERRGRDWNTPAAAPERAASDAKERTAIVAAAAVA